MERKSVRKTAADYDVTIRNVNQLNNDYEAYEFKEQAHKAASRLMERMADKSPDYLIMVSEYLSDMTKAKKRSSFSKDRTPDGRFVADQEQAPPQAPEERSRKRVTPFGSFNLDPFGFEIKDKE